jgi:hypothetical protein
MVEEAGKEEVDAAQDRAEVHEAAVGDPSQSELVTGIYRAISEMANDLDDIHRFLMALAEDSGTRLPRKTTNRNTPTWRPREDAYDMRQTVDYIVQTLPPSDIVQCAAEHIQVTWNRTIVRGGPSNESRRLETDLSGEGEKSLFFWDVLEGDDWRNQAEMSEFGYDSDGRLCLLGVYGRPEVPDIDDPENIDLAALLDMDRSKRAVVEHVVLITQAFPLDQSPLWRVSSLC